MPVPKMDHYIGIDVGTGSARACVIDNTGNIVGLTSENIGLWQPEQGFYVRAWFLGHSYEIPTGRPKDEMLGETDSED